MNGHPVSALNYGNQDYNQEATVYVGNLDEKVTESLLYELMVQTGPIVSVHIPKDRITSSHQGFGFVEFASEEDADYCVKIMNLIRLFGKPIRVNKASSNKRDFDMGATLFIGNLSLEVDEKQLYDTFSAFGKILAAPRLQRDGVTGVSKGFAFISFDNFESADLAIESLNGQFLGGRPVNLSYALKRDGHGAKHGTASERFIASEARKHKMLPSQQQTEASSIASSISLPVGMYLQPQQ